MRRLTIFAKGNLDVKNSLHSFFLGGKFVWNGINEIVRQRYPGTIVHLRHETWTRSDALLASTGVVPAELEMRHLPLSAYAAQSQFSRLGRHQSGKRKAVIIIRERNGRSLPAVFRTEGQALSFIRSRIAKGTIVNADEGSSWDALQPNMK